jgi:hypothetical protein
MTHRCPVSVNRQTTRPKRSQPAKGTKFLRNGLAIGPALILVQSTQPTCGDHWQV